ncbi:hypothetical protein A1D22_10845 [Pasteurellaceae bacterium LFhippo2]|nr:hypothetical protein [Pasteurellaceae bacterium LFhippo2]
MKNSHLLQKDFVTVGVIFENNLSIDKLLEEDYSFKKDLCVYTYKAEANIGLKVGDFVVVHASNEAKIVRVVEVHQFPKLTDKFQYKWVIQKIDLTAYRKRLEEEKTISALLERLALLEQQNELLQRIQQAEKTDARFAELMAKFRKNQGN